MSVRKRKSGNWLIDISLGRKKRKEFTFVGSEHDALLFEAHMKKVLTGKPKQINKNTLDDIVSHYDFAEKEIPHSENNIRTHIYRRCFARAKKKKTPFSLTMDDINKLFEESMGKCSLTGIEFVFKYGTTKRWNPYAPSIDKIDPKGGYTKDNIRLVCAAVNIALHTWGLAVFDKLVICRYKQMRGK